MEDFNKYESTVAVPPLDLLKLQILRRRADVLNAITLYTRRLQRTNQSPPSHLVHSSILIFFFELEAGLKRWLTPSAYNELKKHVFANDYQSNLKAFRIINNELDARRIIRIDLESGYDATRVESENEVKGV